MRLFEIITTINYDNWRLPTEEELRKEYEYKKQKPYVSELGLTGQINCWDSWSNINEAVKQGKIVSLPYDNYNKIIRLSHVSSLQSLVDISMNYRSGPRDPYRIEKGFKDNDPIPMAIIMEVGKRLILTAGNTRLNTARICKKVSWTPDTVNLDYGGGKFDQATLYLEMQGVTNLVYDPYNRSEAHNAAVIEILSQKKADTAMISNVLNVIKELEVRLNILKNVKSLVKPEGLVYISCYEGNRSGIGKPSQFKKVDSWQNNRPTKDYLDEVRRIFPSATYTNGIIIAS